LACEPEWGCTLMWSPPKICLARSRARFLDNIGVLAAAVIAPAGVALRIFISEDGTGSLEHGFRDEVFTGNHFQPLVLAEGFVIKGGGYVGVGLGEGESHAVSHTEILRHFRMGEPLNKPVSISEHSLVKLGRQLSFAESLADTLKTGLPHGARKALPRDWNLLSFELNDREMDEIPMDCAGCDDDSVSAAGGWADWEHTAGWN